MTESADVSTGDVRANAPASVISCPWCGGDPFGADANDAAGACRTCAREWAAESYGIRWVAPPHQVRPSRSLSASLRGRLDPLVATWSPLVRRAGRTVDGYYDEALRSDERAQRWAARWLSGLDVRPGAKLLDFGCGRGRHLAMAARLGFECFGQDVAAHPWWQQLPGATIQLVPQEATRLPWASDAFDVVVQSMVAHHLDASRLAMHFSEITRVLAPGGYLLLEEANSEGLGARVARSYYGRLHSRDTMRRLAASAGLTVTDERTEGFYSPIAGRYVDYARRYLLSRTFDYVDDRSRLARGLPAARRRMWLARLRKPAVAHDLPAAR